MFGKFFRRKTTTKKTAPDGTVTEQTTEEATGDPAEAAAAEAEAERLFAEADNLFAHADEFFAAMGRPPARPFSRAKKAEKPKEEKAAPPPDFLAHQPPGDQIVFFGTITGVFRYKGKYYRYQSGEQTSGIEPAGYYALDPYHPHLGQP